MSLRGHWGRLAAPLRAGTFSVAVLLALLPGGGCQAQEGGDPLTAAVSPAPSPGTQRPATAPAVRPQPSAPARRRPEPSIYRSGAHGFDASFPQCHNGPMPHGAQFSILGVNGGRPFSVNPCLGTQWRAAPHPRALYVNSAFNPHISGRQTPRCRELGKRRATPERWQQAYALGCAEAQYSVGVARSARVGVPFMWWIDVELENTWDETDLTLNRSMLQGEIDRLREEGRHVGVYSTSRDWLGIVGQWTPSGVSGEWVAGQVPSVACAGPGFGGMPVWLVQEPRTWPPPSGYDSNWAC